MLYKLNKFDNKNKYEKVKKISLSEMGWKEKDLEDLVSNNLSDFISYNEMMTIFTERSRKEEPDIMALDQNGDLFIFELKRWSGKQEHLLQVLRYGQLFGNSNYEELNKLYQKYQKSSKANLLNDFNNYFEKELVPEQFNSTQHFIILTNGLDQATIEAILYWKKCGLQIDAIVYWVFQIGNENFIEFNTYSKTEDYLQYENNCYILNTNEKTDEKYTEQMLKEHKAAAYYPRWREKIQKLQKGDLVFLYKNGTGIIAYGYANGVLNKAPCDGYENYEYNMHLDNFVELKTPVSASKMKNIKGYGFSLRHTLNSVEEKVAHKILEYINKNQLASK